MTIQMEKVSQKQADVRSYEPSQLLVSNDLVGMEVEAENVQQRVGRMPELKFWSIVEDGSLRNNGLEFIFKQPLSGKDLVLAVRELNAKFQIAGVNPEYTERTSLHVHVDIRDLTFPQFVNMVIIYSSFEKPLFKFAGEHRQTNLFCLSFDQAEGDKLQLGRMSEVQSPSDLHYLMREFNKYSACNLAAVIRHGSLEFRQHVGTHDPARILKWVNILLSLKKYAKTLDELPTVDSLRQISELGIDEFMTRVFGEHAQSLAYRDMEHDVISGIRHAQDIIFGAKLATVKSAPEKGRYDPETAFMKYLKKKHPKRFDNYVKKAGEGPPEEIEDEMLRVLQELGIDFNA